MESNEKTGKSPHKNQNKKQIIKFNSFPENMPLKKENNIRFIHISDTHGLHERVILPEGDVLIHSGDFCRRYGSHEEVSDFAIWFKKQNFKYKIVIAGNHEMTFD